MSHAWERTNGYVVLVGNTEVKRPLGRRRHVSEDNIGMNLRKIGWGMDWIPLTENRDQTAGSC
jgi:hypothetical protein